VAGLPAEKRGGFTWDDYRTWPDDQRWEIIGGEAFNMSPAPLVRHQIVSRELEHRLVAHFRGKKCQVFDAPIDVRLSEDDIVQPDLVVVCNPRQIKTTHIEGAPTLAIEITSPTTFRHDRVRKMDLYARHGVREYWVVTPHPSLIEIFVLKGDAYRLHAGYDKEETLRSPAFPGLEMALREVFDFPLDRGEEVRVVKEGHPPYAVKKQAEHRETDRPPS
jgi:Uma2 family endonuclease